MKSDSTSAESTKPVTGLFQEPAGHPMYPFIVLDTETTGMGPSARIIELAMVEVNHGKVTARWEWLINPGQHISSFITRLTGIDDSMVLEAPSFADIWPEVERIMTGHWVVAQNASFDRGMFRNEWKRLGIRDPGWTWLCTVRLGRRLWPGLKSYSLSSMARFHGIRNPRAHRAMGDAETTASLFILQTDTFIEKFPDKSLQDLSKFQYGKVDENRPLPATVARLKDLVSETFPSSAGVYWFEDTHGRILYVGKAVDLRSWVLSYFTGRHNQSSKNLKMIRLARQVRFAETQTELGALVQESRLIKQYQPPYNRLLLDYQSYPFLKLDRRHPFPRLEATRHLNDRSADYYGPFASSFHAGAIHDWMLDTGWLRPCDDSTFARGKLCTYYSLGKCPGPCAGEISKEAYGERIDVLAGFLSGENRALTDSLNSRMQEAAANEQFEWAAVLRDRIRELGRVFLYFNRANGLTRQSLVVKHPRAGQQEAFDFYFIRFGLLINHGHVAGQEANREFELQLSEFREMVASQPPPDQFGPEAVDEMRLVLNWLNLHRKELEILL